MPPGTDQIRLLWAAALVTIPLVAGYRFARRLQSPVGAICDAILLAYLIEYITVGIAGLLGFLSAVSLTLIALPLCAGLYLSARFVPVASDNSRVGPVERRWVLGTCLVAVGFVAAMVWAQRIQPPLATDALTYHLPAAVSWLQKGRIAIFQTWFFNPANTYSPLAGSIFVTWLLAPMGNDVLARFVQVGPWALMLFAALNLGKSSLAGALAAVAVVLSRPFVVEAILAKDDLFVSAFFLLAVTALLPNRLSGKYGAARLGIAIGLMLATKYTALMILPMLLLACDAPIRAGWRWKQWSVTVAIVALIAGPWYLRNLICWGNPLFPVKFNFPGIHFPGLLPSIHSVHTPAALWEIMTGGYYSLPPVFFVFLSVMWLMVFIRSGRMLLHDPLQRVLVLGPVVGIAIFAMFSPQAEVRFLLPAFGLMFMLCPMVGIGWKSVTVSAIAAVVAITSSFEWSNANQIVYFAACGLGLAMVGVLIRWVEADCVGFEWPLISWIVAGTVLLFAWLQWGNYQNEYHDADLVVWEAVYPEQGEMWNFVDQNVPSTATVAYSNQFMIYPLYGFDFHRKVIYAPVRRGASVSNLVFSGSVSDSNLVQKAIDATNAPADLSAWLENLRAAGAQYLVVGRSGNAPEIAWAEADPHQFVRLFVNSEAVVYRIDDLH